MEKIRKTPDFILLGIVSTLLIFGVLILSSASVHISQEKFGNTYYFLNHQILFGIIPGLILAILFFIIPLEFLRKWAPFLLLINIILLAMVFLPPIPNFGVGGLALKGGARWISIGPITFQPSEFLKLTFILYLASWLSRRTTQEKFGQTLIAFFIIIGIISLFLVFQPDIGTLGIIILTASLMYFSARTPFWHTLLIFLIALAGVFSLINLASYRMKRLWVFLNPEIDPLGMGYQIKQALIGLGSGGILGLGLGLSRQKFGLLPHPISDSIFAIFSEETGFLGSLILISLFLIFFWRGVKILNKAKTEFKKLVVLGISSWFILQAFVNISSLIGLVPLTGIPLPFISYGGSHLIAEMIGVGILLNISKEIGK